jgi:hypothetical protein
MLEFPGHSEHLANIGRTDEDEVDVVDRRDRLDRGDRLRGLDLNADERLGVRSRHVFGDRRQAEPSVPVPAIRPRSPRGQNFAHRTALSASSADRIMLKITPPAPASSDLIT